ncbi:PDLI7 protein, partial [Amia calva]|nr:PDLI7 protein [Amia calva]
MNVYCVALKGPAPWGFRLQGGKDFSMPLTVSRLTPGGKAAQAGVGVGDWVVSIDNSNAEDMTHVEAQNKIRAASDTLALSLSSFCTVPPCATLDFLLILLPRVDKLISTLIEDNWEFFQLDAGRIAHCLFPVYNVLAATQRLLSGPACREPDPIARSRSVIDKKHSSCCRDKSSSGINAPSSGIASLSLTSRTCIQPKYSFAPSSALNKVPRPFGAGSDSSNAGPPTKPVTYSPSAPKFNPGVQTPVHVQQQHNGHSLRMDSVPCFIANDASKKRLIEDTQDWQPRTGTTQSRSFRILAQLTGTDFSNVSDTVIYRSSFPPPFQLVSEVGICEVSPPPHHPPQKKPSALHYQHHKSLYPGNENLDKPVKGFSLYKGAPKAPAPATGPSSRPPWVTDPGFADRYRPDKTSTVMTRHSQPVQPTPMQNRSSIVQAAQQAPEDSGRTPVCAACSKVIRGRYLVALGRSWHPEEFTCSQCKVVLEEGGFFEERGSVFCTKCYDSRYAPNCAKCKKKITGEIMHALKMTWHVQCFMCAACKTPIRNQAFYMEEGEPYCEKDYEKMFGTKCHGCDFKIDAGDRFLEALGYSWHDTCFVCAICQMNLEGKTFYSKKDKPLCKTHAFSHV